jgi:dTDP-4-dehydrorhamnose 3,5-epimerase
MTSPSPSSLPDWIRPQAIPELVLFTPRQFHDDRGYFMETARASWFTDHGIDLPSPFVQDNLSKSTKGVIRGLHYQIGASAQGKFVGVAKGTITDVAVDIRKGSPTFGQVVQVTLSAENGHMLWIPPGFAHGFSVHSEEALVQYKCTAYYDASAERGIHPLDETLAIDWGIGHGMDHGIEKPLISPKDLDLPRFEDLPAEALF